MHTHRTIRTLLFAAATLTVILAGAGGAAAQDDDSTTSTTQLDLGGEPEGSTTTAPTSTTSAPESTSTTQLQVAGESDTREPPTRVDAGAGGTANGPGVPVAGIVLAGALVAVTGAAALKMRRDLAGMTGATATVQSTSERNQQ